MTYMLIAGVFSVIGMVVQGRLKGKFSKYSKMGISSGLSGAEVAEQMLQHYNIHDVKIVQGKGFLTDHYNPKSKVISLSPGVYQGRSVASAAVAAHECGHAVQHATAYSWLQMRSALVPVVSVAARSQQWLLLLALGGLGAGFGDTLLLITILAFAATTAFALITLPVEFDASKRALVWLDNTNVTRTGTGETKGAKDALHWAAMTYVVSALSSLAMLVWLILRYVGRN